MIYNIILITIDSLRADHAGFINEERSDLTPNLNEFARRCLIFDNAFSTGPCTTMSMPSLFTSRYPSRLISFQYGVYIGEHVILPELLKRSGYHTFGIHSNPFLSSLFGYERGFDYFYDDLFLKNIKLPEKVKLLMNNIRRVFRNNPDITAEELNKMAFKIIDRIQSPFFLWLHYMDPHGPYRAKKGSFLNKFREDRLWVKSISSPCKLTDREKEKLVSDYQGEIKYLDDNLGVLFEKLEKIDMLKKTIIIITADHGESFGEHGRYSHTDMVYDELIRVPLLIYHPMIKSERRKELINLIDLVPTIMDFLGIAHNQEFEGYIIGKENGLHSKMIISEARVTPAWYGCVRNSEWKCISNRIDKKVELYHLVEDPLEKNDLSGQYPDKVSEFEKIIGRHISKKVLAEEEINMDEVIKKRLKDLGYIE